MAIAAFLPIDSLTRLRRAADPERIEAFSSLDELYAGLTRRRHDALVLDLSLLGGRGTRALQEFLRIHPLPVIGFSTLAPHSVRAMLNLLPMVHAAIVRGFDDEVVHLHNALDQLPARTYGMKFLSQLRVPLDSLPPGPQAAIVAVFSSAPFRSTRIVATVAGISRRSLDRWLHALGLQPISWFVRGARILRLVPLIEADVSIRRALMVEHYDSRRSLSRHVTPLLGVPVSRFINMAREDGEVIVETLARRAGRGGRV